MMTDFRKSLMTCLTVLTLGAASVSSFAQQAAPAGAQARPEQGQMRERMQERRAKHIADLHDSLKLTPAQEPAWKKFTDSLNAAEAQRRPDRAGAPDQAASAVERMENRLAWMQQAEKALSGRIAATKEFYALLTPDQQRVFNDKFGPRPHRMHRGEHGGHDGQGRDGK